MIRLLALILIVILISISAEILTHNYIYCMKCFRPLPFIVEGREYAKSGR